MGRIHVLPDAVANKIAAGEVVERPASVVKELLENSLDAEAREIRVDIEAGGRRLIRLSDDGVGMMRDDALNAFERHATSKIRSADDLFSVGTLGFRGEALPSIASVSRLDLETRAREDTVGTRIEIAGAKMLRCDDFAREPGTTITVRDLFYNVPARRKFLRSEQTELAHIASLVTHYSLSRRDLSFALTHNGMHLLTAPPVATLRERVFQIFGGEILADLIELPPLDHGEFRLTGFVSQPQIQKLNRNSIYLFVNGRLIRDRLLLHALTAAYHNLMPPQCFPFALLFLSCAPEEVDVNVHPAKTEVRFQHGSVVHDFVRDAIRQVLLDSRPPSRLPLPAESASPQPVVDLPMSEFSLRADSTPPPLPQQARLVIPDVRDVEEPVVTLPRAPIRSEPVRLPIPDTHGALPDGAWQDPAVSLDALRDLRVLGQLHNSFIVAAGRDGLWIIDQHVAHERILFEQALRRAGTSAVERQPLLIPLIVPLTIGQQVEFARIETELAAVGFEAEPFGARTLAIKAAPAGLDAGQIERAVLEILEVAENELRQASLDEIRRGVCASVACRAAIKINTPLEPEKMEWLLAELARTEFPTSCPHGRPIALRYGMRDILKGFHRI
jgi:DNA mismatch repair protein MutL